jgi:hypothetical protein
MNAEDMFKETSVRTVAILVGCALGPCCSRESEAVTPETSTPANAQPGERAPAAPERPWTAVRLQSVDLGGQTVRAEFDFAGRLALPTARLTEPMRAGSVILIAQDAVVLDGKPIATIVGGAVSADAVRDHRIHRVELGLADAGATHAVIFADGATALDPVIDVLNTVLRAGVARPQFAVLRADSAAQEASHAVEMRPLQFTTTSDGGLKFGGFDAALVVELDADEARVGLRPAGVTGQTSLLATLPRPDREPAAARQLAELAQESAARLRGPGNAFPPAVITAGPGVTLQSVLAVRDVLAGPQCTRAELAAVDRGRCWFPIWTLQGAENGPS